MDTPHGEHQAKLMHDSYCSVSKTGSLIPSGSKLKKFCSHWDFLKVKKWVDIKESFPDLK